MKERGAQRLSNERADSSARWAEVYERFRGVDRSRLAPHELEAFADAAWWLNRLRESIGARQRAYAGYDAAGDARRAAYCAWFLSYDYAIKGDAAVASGWLKRAQRHLAAEPECLEHGLLALAEADGALARGEPDAARAHAARVREIGERVASPDVIAMGTQTEGRALVAAGKIAEGCALLDEAMSSVIAGQLSPFFTGWVYAGDSTTDAAVRISAEGGAPSHLARIEGDLAGEAPSAIESELSGHAIEAGFVTAPDTVGGLYRLREGADAVAGDATPAGTAPFRTDILPDHEAAPSAVEGTTEGTAIDLSTIDPSLMTPYAPEPGTYVESDTFEVAARHLEAVETGNVGAVEEPEHIEGLHRMREIEGNERLDVDTTTEGGDQIPVYTEGEEGITE